MPPSIGLNLRVTGHSHQGGRKYMEDIFSVAYQSTADEKDLEYAFFGIFDGHGGREAAQYAKENLMDSIIKHKHFWSDRDEDVLRAIRDGFVATHHAMWSVLETWPRTASGLPSTSGTTASVAFLRRGRIYLGHVGDSGIVLGESENREDEWKAVPLTHDHKPESPAESQRITKAGGKVVYKLGVPRVVWNRPKPGHKGPVRRSTPFDEVPFLAVARSLGDLWSHNQEQDMFVVSPEPDVSVLVADPVRHRCLILGTDGLWNVTSPQRAVSIVQETERYNEACYEENDHEAWMNPSHRLVQNALQQWNHLRLRADNTSVVTLILDPPGPPRFQPTRTRRNSCGVPNPSARPHQERHVERRVPEAAPAETGMVREVASMLQAKEGCPGESPPHLPTPPASPQQPVLETSCSARGKEAITTNSQTFVPLAHATRAHSRTREVTPEDSKTKKRQTPSPATVPSKKRSILSENRASNESARVGRHSRLLQPHTLVRRELRSNTLPPRRRLRPHK